MDKIRIILGYGASSVGIRFPTFRDNADVLFQESKYPRRMHLFLEISTLENEDRYVVSKRREPNNQ
jgi:hypothetical protein